jgi:PAP2 superfamily protein
MTILAHDKGWLRNFHYWASALLTFALIPCLKRFNLPVNFNWVGLGSAYWLVLSAQSIFVATILCVIGLPPEQIIVPLIRRLQREKLRIVFLLTYLSVLAWAFTWTKGIILTVDTVALLEFRGRFNGKEARRIALSLFVPVAYLFAGFLLVFAYNDIILSVRFFGATDAAFNAADEWILHGGSVSGICHWAVRLFPVSFFHFLEFIYFGMFPQIGAALILSTLYCGKKRGLEFVGAILIAYYLSLFLFYLWPSQGPYYLCPNHFLQFPSTLRTYTAQAGFLERSKALWNHVHRGPISFDYFIAFPCMHIAQPLIAMWFLRRWKRMVIALAAYDVLLLVAIVLLEWHYIVDILAGILVAGVAIAMVGDRVLKDWARKSRMNSHDLQPKASPERLAPL